jgi:hypothetical protein
MRLIMLIRNVMLHVHSAHLLRTYVLLVLWVIIYKIQNASNVKMNAENAHLLLNYVPLVILVTIYKIQNAINVNMNVENAKMNKFAIHVSRVFTLIIQKIFALSVRKDAFLVNSSTNVNNVKWTITI